jgi:hypothetical protein
MRTDIVSGMGQQSSLVHGTAALIRAVDAGFSYLVTV